TINFGILTPLFLFYYLIRLDFVTRNSLILLNLIFYIFIKIIKIVNNDSMKVVERMMVRFEMRREVGWWECVPDIFLMCILFR
ncbi:MAG: hypothetical protein ACTSO8_06960, partial [Promethearchaeota archaeon]